MVETMEEIHKNHNTDKLKQIILIQKCLPVVLSRTYCSGHELPTHQTIPKSSHERCEEKLEKYIFPVVQKNGRSSCHSPALMSSPHLHEYFLKQRLSTFVRSPRAGQTSRGRYNPNPENMRANQKAKKSNYLQVDASLASSTVKNLVFPQSTLRTETPSSVCSDLKLFWKILVRADEAWDGDKN